MHILTSINLSLNCIGRSLDVCHRLSCQRAAWETALLLVLLEQGLKIQTAQTQGRASVSRPAARLVTKCSTASRLFTFDRSAAPQEPFHLLKAHAACNVEKITRWVNVVIMIQTWQQRWSHLLFKCPCLLPTCLSQLILTIDKCYNCNVSLRLSSYSQSTPNEPLPAAL